MESTIVATMWSIGVLAACAASVGLRHANLSAAVEDAHSNIVARFIGPEGLLRDYEGMIVRGFGTDGVCHYPLGSEDQTLPWFYGLHAYWRSGIPSAEEKASVAAKVREVADDFRAGLARNAAREDVDRTLRSYDYSQINLCEFFLAELAAERMFKLVPASGE